MREPAFLTETEPPTMEQCAAAMGVAWQTWADATDGHAGLKPSWRHSKTSGWYLTYDRGARRICYCFPREGGFLLKVVFNAKGMKLLKEAGLAASQSARAVHAAEGHVLEFVETEIAAPELRALLAVKIASVG